MSGRPDLAFKSYRRPTPERTAKLRVMVAHPPDVDRRKGAIAWPLEIVTGGDGQAQGFLMPRVDLTTYVPLFRVYNPASRHRLAPGITWRFLLRTARNVAAVVDAVHRSECVVGDLNESNLLVNDRALVTLVDCDSMQVRDPASGTLHHCPVGKPEFTAPELCGADLAVKPRTEASDAFALSVLVFQLLLEGVHPFGGVWRGRGEPPDIGERIARRRFPYRRHVRSLRPPPTGLGLDVLPPEVRRLVWRTFTAGSRRPTRRPTAADWLSALERAESRLKTCDRSPHHEFGAHLRRCPWCARIDSGLPDPFPGPSGRSALAVRPPPVVKRVRQRAATAIATALVATRSVMARAVSKAARSASVREPVVLIALFVLASLAPPMVVVPGTAVALAVAHARHQAARAGRGRLRVAAAAARLLPGNLRTAARAGAVSVLVGAAVTVAAALAYATASAAALPGADPLEAAQDQLRWGAATAVLLLVRWPRGGDRSWAQGVARARARLRNP